MLRNDIPKRQSVVRDGPADNMSRERKHGAVHILCGMATERRARAPRGQREQPTVQGPHSPSQIASTWQQREYPCPIPIGCGVILVERQQTTLPFASTWRSFGLCGAQRAALAMLR